MDFPRFQEIVPLNAGNILVAENNGPAAKWLTLIHQTLNNSGTSKNRNQCRCLSHCREKSAEIPVLVTGILLEVVVTG